MTELKQIDSHGELIAPDTLKLQRLLPGPAERIWRYLTESDLRRKWLAAGDMEQVVGAPFELVWRNHELTDPPGQRPEGFGEEHSMKSVVTECDPPRRLSFTWGESGEVTFSLTDVGNEVLFTILHKGICERKMKVMVSSGWHAHADVLADVLSGRTPAPFWDSWIGLRDEYEARTPED